MEYRLAHRFVEDSDFHEGVSALLIRKDNKPKWKEASVASVSDEVVENYFRPLSKEFELKL